MLDFIPVQTDEEIDQLAKIADEIWHEYWPGTLSYTQVDYMVDKFQSIPALTLDIRENNYEYWLLKAHENIVGYTGGREETETNRYFISKVYLYDTERGKGYASRVIEHYQKICLERGLESMYLTVNKYNELGIRAYLAKGFDIVDSTVSSIGQGFVMDDFIMEKRLEEEQRGKKHASS